MCRYFNIVSNWTVSELLNCKFVNKAEIELTGKSHYIHYIYTYFLMSIFLCFSTYCIHICILFRCVVSARRMSVQTILLLFFLLFFLAVRPTDVIISTLT